VRRILVIATPGIGDALLATPLVRSLKLAFPRATIDMIVRDGRAIVDCNPDLSRVLVRRRRPPFWDDLKFMARVARRYDLAVSTSTTDRAFIYMLVAASRRVGVVASLTPKSWWKRKIARCVWADPDVHTLSRNLELAGLLNIERHWGLVIPGNPPNAETGSEIQRLESSNLPYAVIHMKPASAAREWPSGYWQSVIESLGQRGLAVAATGGGDSAERAYVAEILSRWAPGRKNHPGVFDLAGQLSFGDIARLLQRATVYIGIDTSTTHVAASTGVPTIALFGPTDVVRWGPWPRGLEQTGSPYRRNEASQTVGNVTVLQEPCACSALRRPCQLAPGMPGSCMHGILPDRVLAAMDDALRHPGPSAQAH